MSEQLIVEKMAGQCTVGGFYTLSRPNMPPDAYVSSILDAKLYAAAPELLAACKEFAKWFDAWCPQNKCCANTGLPIHEQVLKAIAKATGN